MPQSVLHSESPVAAWRRRLTEAVRAYRDAGRLFVELAAVPGGDPAERLALLVDVAAELGLPSPSYSVNMQDGLIAWARALATAADPAEVQRDLRVLVAALDNAVCADLQAGASDPRLVRTADFGDGLLAAVGLADAPFTPLDGARNFDVQTGAGTGYTSVLIHGLQSHLRHDHHLRAALPPEQMVQLPQGPAYFLGAGDLAFTPDGVPYGKPRPYYRVAEVAAATAARRAAQLQAQEREAADRAWQEAQRAVSAALRKTPAEEKAERELAETRRQLQEQREAAERTQAQLRDLLRRQEELELEARRGEVA